MSHLKIWPLNTKLFTPNITGILTQEPKALARPYSDIPAVIVLTSTLWAVSLEATVTGSLQLSSKVTGERQFPLMLSGSGRARCKCGKNPSVHEQFLSDHHPRGQKIARRMTDKAQHWKMPILVLLKWKKYAYIYSTKERERVCFHFYKVSL